MSISDQWCSPPEIAAALWEFFHGPVGVDPCSNKRSVIRARLSYMRGGLVLPWRSANPRSPRTVFENPPYSQGTEWARKAIAEMGCGNVCELVRLTMFVTSAAWWRGVCLTPKRNPRILGLRRLAFIDPRPEARLNPTLLCAADLYLRDPETERAGLAILETAYRRRTKTDPDVQTCRFEPALMYFGPRVRQFDRAFSHLTNWSTWGR